MAKQGTLHFHPERIIWIGVIAACGAFLFAIPFLISLCCGDLPGMTLFAKEEAEKERPPLQFSLGLKEKAPFLPIPDLQNEMTFSFDPPRPDGGVEKLRLLVRLKKGAESRRVVLPCRLDLEYKWEKLQFAKDQSSFWIELIQRADGQIEGKGLISSLEEEKIDAGTFLVTAQESPVQTASEFGEGTPFRLLAEARWWGRDVFREQYGEGAIAERLEVGANELLELKEGKWLVWKEQHWELADMPEKEKPIAHIHSQAGRNLVLEGWDHDGHIRLALSPAVSPPFKAKGEELFTSVRVRSEKQISCMLEKQCMVLKTGDWILKANGRWKILRKKEERAAFLNGKLFGDLFVFDQIHQKQGQKVIQGRIFNPSRTQVASIEVAAQSQRKSGKKGKVQ